MEEDARLAPGLTLATELKGATGQRMKGMGDRKDLHLI
jgi:hypothetical protein